MIPKSATRPLVTAGTLLGIGMGGFVDGILFHQILQLHNMLSNRVLRDTLVHEQINMFWDGLFHAFTWTCVALGLLLLWQAVKRPGAILSGRALSGAMALGWGLFNLIEGLMDHQILQLHHVYQNGNHLLWDLVFLASGPLLIALGLLLIRQGFTRSAPQSRSLVGPA
ncbi:MAG TPA: DUF2243 domain-containing protein [Acidobacteriaceae bacterium]|jgi:uncharacterized membrane protein|nr:DUF2243 domain-containing protein [Acidobacteriaceae bacterium]